MLTWVHQQFILGHSLTLAVERVVELTGRNYMREPYADVQVAEFVPVHLCTKDTGVEQSSGLSVFQCHNVP